MRENLAANTDTDTQPEHQSVPDTSPDTNDTNAPYDPKAKRRRNPLVELLDELQTVIRNPKSSPQTVEKALSDKKDILFHQAAEKKDNLQDRVSALEKENAALLQELAPESTPENPSPEGARQKAEKYDKLKPESALLKTADREQKAAISTAKIDHAALLSSFRCFINWTKVLFKESDRKLLAFKFFLRYGLDGQNKEVMEGWEITDAQRWQALRERFSIPLIPLGTKFTVEDKTKFVKLYDRVTKDKDANAQEFLRTLLQLCGITDPDQAVKLLRETEATNSPVTPRTFTQEPQGLEEKQPADPCAAAQERLIEQADRQVERSQRNQGADVDRDWTLPNG